MRKEILFVSKAGDQDVKLYKVTSLIFTKSDLVLSGIRKPEEYKKLDRASFDSERAFYNLLNKAFFSKETFDIINNRETRNNIDVYLDKQSTLFGLGEKYVLDYSLLDLQRDLALEEAKEGKVKVKIVIPKWIENNPRFKEAFEKITSRNNHSPVVNQMLEELDPSELNKLFGGVNGRKPYCINIPLLESTNNLYANAIDSKPLDITFNEYDFKPLYSFFQSVVERSGKEKEHREILNSALKKMDSQKDKQVRNKINISFKDNEFYIGVQENNPTLRIGHMEPIVELKFCNMYLVLKDAVEVKMYLNKLASEFGLPIQSFLSSGITINYFVEEYTARELMKKIKVNEKAFKLVNKIIHVLVDKDKLTFDVNVNQMYKYSNIQNDKRDMLFIYSDQLTQRTEEIYIDVDKLSKSLYATNLSCVFKDKLVTFLPVMTQSYVQTNECETLYPSLHKSIVAAISDVNSKVKCKDNVDVTNSENELVKGCCNYNKPLYPTTINNLWDEYENKHQKFQTKPQIRVLDVDTSLVVKATNIGDLNTVLTKINNGIELWMFSCGDKTGFNKACSDYLNNEGYSNSEDSIYLVSMSFSEKYLKDIEGYLSLVYLREIKHKTKVDGLIDEPSKVHFGPILYDPFSTFTNDNETPFKVVDGLSDLINIARKVSPTAVKDMVCLKDNCTKGHGIESGFKHPSIVEENKSQPEDCSDFGAKLNLESVKNNVKISFTNDNKILYIHYDIDNRVSEVRLGVDLQVDYDKYIYHADNVLSHIENYRDGKKIGCTYLDAESGTLGGETLDEEIIANDFINGKYIWIVFRNRIDCNDGKELHNANIKRTFNKKYFWLLPTDKYDVVYDQVIKDISYKLETDKKPDYILISYTAAQDAKYGLEKLLPELTILDGGIIIRQFKELMSKNETK